MRTIFGLQRTTGSAIAIWGMRDGLWQRSHKRGLNRRPLAWNQQFNLCTVFGVLP